MVGKVAHHIVTCNKMKVYVAGHDQKEARRVAAALRAVGVQVKSSWLDEDFQRTSFYSDEDRCRIAIQDVEEVQDADALVFLASLHRVPGGKFVEVGVALGLNKPVHLIGHRENMLMWHPNVEAWDSLEDLVKFVDPSPRTRQKA
jgi:nucleoside 2-deoxyribosyltransferase